MIANSHVFHVICACIQQDPDIAEKISNDVHLVFFFRCAVLQPFSGRIETCCFLPVRRIFRHLTSCIYQTHLYFQTDLNFVYVGWK